MGSEGGDGKLQKSLSERIVRGKKSKGKVEADMPRSASGRVAGRFASSLGGRTRRKGDGDSAGAGNSAHGCARAGNAGSSVQVLMLEHVLLLERVLPDVLIDYVLIS